MRKSRTSGSVGGLGGNAQADPTERSPPGVASVELEQVVQIVSREALAAAGVFAEHR